ncbi:MAG: hypothetical protein KAI64_06190 [Thermoplasmata archaeon]|nr:hypothetical protein [Thermoplasmata archaeon]
MTDYSRNDTGELQEWQLTYNYLLGQSAGVEEYSRTLRQESGDMYAMGKDTEAQIYRDLADEAKAHSIRMRKQADEHKERYADD